MKIPTLSLLLGVSLLFAVVHSNPPVVGIVGSQFSASTPPSLSLNGIYYSGVDYLNGTSGVSTTYFPTGNCTDESNYFITLSNQFWCIGYGASNSISINQINPLTKTVLSAYAYTGSYGASFQLKGNYILVLGSNFGFNLELDVFNTETNQVECSVSPMPTLDGIVYDTAYSEGNVIFTTANGSELFLNYFTCEGSQIVHTLYQGINFDGVLTGLNKSSVFVLNYKPSTKAVTSSILPLVYDTLGNFQFGSVTSGYGDVLQINDTNFVYQYASNGELVWGLYYVNSKFQTVQVASFNSGINATLYGGKLNVSALSGSTTIWISLGDSSYLTYDFTLGQITSVVGDYSPVSLSNGTTVYLTGMGYFLQSLDGGINFTPVETNLYYQSEIYPTTVWAFYALPLVSNPSGECVLLEINGANSFISTTYFTKCPAVSLVDSTILDVSYDSGNNPWVSYRNVLNQLYILNPNTTYGPYSLTLNFLYSTISLNITNGYGTLLGKGLGVFNLSHFYINNGSVFQTKRLSGQLNEYCVKLNTQYFMIATSYSGSSVFSVIDTLTDQYVSQVTIPVSLSLSFTNLPFVVMGINPYLSTTYSGILVPNANSVTVINPSGQTTSLNVAPLKIVEIQPCTANSFYLWTTDGLLANYLSLYEVNFAGTVVELKTTVHI